MERWNTTFLHRVTVMIPRKHARNAVSNSSWSFGQKLITETVTSYGRNLQARHKEIKFCKHGISTVDGRNRNTWSACEKNVQTLQSQCFKRNRVTFWNSGVEASIARRSDREARRHVASDSASRYGMSSDHASTWNIIKRKFLMKFGKGGGRMDTTRCSGHVSARSLLETKMTSFSNLPKLNSSS